MERHVLGSGRSVSGRRWGSPRRLRNVVLTDGNRPTFDGKRLLRTATARSAAVLTARKAALFASEMTKNISNEFQKEIRLKIFRNKGFAPDRSARREPSDSGVQRRDAELCAPTMTKNILREFQFEIPLKIFRNKERALAVRKDKSTEKTHFSRLL